MADMDLIFPSWTQHERIAAALESYSSGVFAFSRTQMPI